MAWRRYGVLVCCAAALELLVAVAAGAENFPLTIIALNDFHGNLESPGNSTASAQSAEVPVGGVAVVAAYVERLEARNPYHVVVSAGDLIGASPLISSLFHDEGTIETMNRLGLEISAVGNHEFDKGLSELLRMQHGGCFEHDANSCKGAEVGTPVPFEGAKFQFLAANVFRTSNGQTVFPAYALKTYQGVPVAFIGVTLEDTPTIVSRNAVAGLRFADEASTINEIVRKLGAQGVHCFVVLVHQGGRQTTRGTVDINGCVGGLEGSPIEAIVNKLDDAVDVVLSAHTHQAYVCQVANSGGRKIPVSSASSYGELLTEVQLTLDTASKKAVSVKVQNILVDRSAAAITPNAAIQSIVDKYAALAAPIANRTVGSITADITSAHDTAGESALGDLLADAQLEATRDAGAVVAFMNRGGIRAAKLPYSSGIPGVADGKVTYGELFTMQPFGNSLVTMTLTGTQLKTLLEEQFKGCALDFPRANTAGQPADQILEVSQGFTYSWNPAGTTCNKVDADSIQINGATVRPAGRYRVTANSFLADGGSQLYEFTHGSERVGGVLDVDALAAYFAKHAAVSPSRPERIQVKP